MTTVPLEKSDCNRGMGGSVAELPLGNVLRAGFLLLNVRRSKAANVDVSSEAASRMHGCLCFRSGAGFLSLNWQSCRWNPPIQAVHRRFAAVMTAWTLYMEAACALPRTGTCSVTQGSRSRSSPGLHASSYKTYCLGLGALPVYFLVAVDPTVASRP
jgi:hypothetical protein